jgi:hypothetical protein
MYEIFCKSLHILMCCLLNTILKTQCLEEGTVAGKSSSHEEQGPRKSIGKTSGLKEV